MQMSVPPGVVEDGRKMVLAKFGNLVTAKRTKRLAGCRRDRHQGFRDESGLC
jgi:hypothetical protein